MQVGDRVIYLYEPGATVGTITRKYRAFSGRLVGGNWWVQWGNRELPAFECNLILESDFTEEERQKRISAAR